MRVSRGLSLLEVMVGLLLVGLTALALGPAVSAMLSRKTGAAARQLSTTFQALRWRAVAGGVSRGLLFEADASGWSWREVQDGNANGLRTAEVRDGTDIVLSGPHRLEERVSGTRLGFPSAGPFPGIPPRRGNLAGLDDPVKFGRSNLVSFSPDGRASSGTVYVTDGRKALHAVVVFGPTTRIRVWRFVAETGEWRL